MAEASGKGGGMNTTTTHKTTIVGKCPHGCDDVYEASFIVEGRVLRVEDIDAAIIGCTKEPIYQETLGQALADILECKVVLEGKHGRFETLSISDPESEA